MSKTRTTEIQQSLGLQDKNALAAHLQQTFLEIGAGPQPELARGLSEAIPVSDRGEIHGRIGIRWLWHESYLTPRSDGRSDTKLDLVVSYTEQL